MQTSLRSHSCPHPPVGLRTTRLHPPNLEQPIRTLYDPNAVISPGMSIGHKVANQHPAWDSGAAGGRFIVFLGAGRLGGRASWENLPARLASLLEGGPQSQEVRGTEATASPARTPGSSLAWLLTKTFPTPRMYLALPFWPFLIHFFHSSQKAAIELPPPPLLPHALSLRPLQALPCRASRLTAPPLLAHPLLGGHAPPSPGFPLWFLPLGLLCRRLPPRGVAQPGTAAHLTVPAPAFWHHPSAQGTRSPTSSPDPTSRHLLSVPRRMPILRALGTPALSLSQLPLPSGQGPHSSLCKLNQLQT